MGGSCSEICVEVGEALCLRGGVGVLCCLCCFGLVSGVVGGPLGVDGVGLGLCWVEDLGGFGSFAG